MGQRQDEALRALGRVVAPEGCDDRGGEVVAGVDLGDALQRAQREAAHLGVAGQRRGLLVPSRMRRGLAERRPRSGSAPVEP